MELNFQSLISRTSKNFFKYKGQQKKEVVCNTRDMMLYIFTLWKCNSCRILIHSFECENVKVLVAQSCPTLCDPMDCSSPDSFVYGILQARMQEWVAILFSRGSSWCKDQTQVSWIAGRFFTIWATRKSLLIPSCLQILAYLVWRAVNTWSIACEAYAKRYGGTDSEESSCNIGRMVLTPGSGRSPGEGNVKPLQYSCLEKSMGREAWQAIIHGVINSWTWLSD